MQIRSLDSFCYLVSGYATGRQKIVNGNTPQGDPSLHIAHCTLHIAHCTLHTAHCTFFFSLPICKIRGRIYFMRVPEI